VVGERGKWSGGRRGAHSESQPERNARRRAADGSLPHLRLCTMQARDERVVCEVERAASRWGRGDGQPVQRSKLRVGHGGIQINHEAQFKRCRCAGVPANLMSVRKIKMTIT